MHYIFCPICGEKLVPREMGDDGLVPFCERCAQPYFDSFSTCVICAVVNPRREVALLKQDYIRRGTLVCVSGYMKPGESAEDAAAREIKEELGLDVSRVTYMGSWPMPNKPMLMLGFRAEAPAVPFVLSSEVEDALWVPFDAALPLIRTGSIAYQLVERSIKE